MCKKACIYCGTTENLSASDIIPDALTNAKLLNHNVCKIAHNSRFSDMFESEVISGLAFLTNELNVKSSKGKGYAKYPAIFRINGDDYKVSISSDIDIFKPNHLLSSTDGKHKLGNVEQIKKMANVKPENIKEIDINKIGIEKITPINLNVFFGEAMYRLVTKIAFEWYCLCNNVSGVIPEFQIIIDYITTGKGNPPVQLIENIDFYQIMNEHFDFASHVLLSYVGTDGSINIIVSLFGLIAYNVRLLTQKISSCNKNILFQRLTIDSKRNSFAYSTIDEMYQTMQVSFTQHNVGEFTVETPANLSDTSITYKMFYLIIYNSFQTNLKCIQKPSQSLLKQLKDRISTVFQTSALTMKLLKRFVADHIDLFNKSKKLNPDCPNKEEIFMYYLLFVIGKNSTTIKCFSDLVEYLNGKLENNTLRINDEFINAAKEELFRCENYSSIIVEGAEIVSNWEMQ